MLYPNELAVGLKEWDSVCQALLQGRQIVLLRKGGIHESGGEFELEFRRFLLFPTFLHQDKLMLKDEAQDLFKFSGSEPNTVRIEGYADVTDIVQIHTPEQIAAVDGHHIWTQKMVQGRLDYRPENPVYLLLVRVAALEQAVTIPNHTQYGGCKSWVGLRQTLDVQAAKPVMDAATHQRQRDEILMRIRSAKSAAEI